MTACAFVYTHASGHQGLCGRQTEQCSVIGHGDFRTIPGNSLDEWYPYVRNVVPTPRTRVHVGPDLLALALGESSPMLADAYRSVGGWLQAQGEDLGWPMFVRTGLTSAKHDWRNSCFVPSANDVAPHMNEILEYSAMADLMGLPCDVWVAREMLATEAPFKAFHGQMPITRERRYFVSDGKVIGHHPYWPPEAIEGSFGDVDWDWVQALDALNYESPDEVIALTALSERVSEVMPGAWSVDWLWARRRDDAEAQWFLTDMAHADESFVWWDWPTAPTREAIYGVRWRDLDDGGSPAPATDA